LTTFSPFAAFTNPSTQSRCSSRILFGFCRAPLTANFPFYTSCVNTLTLPPSISSTSHGWYTAMSAPSSMADICHARRPTFPSLGATHSTTSKGKAERPKKEGVNVSPCLSTGPTTAESKSPRYSSVRTIWRRQIIVPRSERRRCRWRSARLGRSCRICRAESPEAK